MNKNTLNKKCPLGGFTLIELLVVIAIIAILAAILIPAISRVRASADSTKCMANLRSIGAGVNMYANDNDGNFPVAKWADDSAPSALLTGSGPNGLGLVVVGGYLGVELEPGASPSGSNRPEVLMCPSDNGRAFFADPNWSSYAYQSPFTTSSGAARTDIAQRRLSVSPGWAIAMDASQAYTGWGGAPHPGETVNVLYADGHVEARPFIGGTNAPAWGVWLGQFDLTEPRQ